MSTPTDTNPAQGYEEYFVPAIFQPLSKLVLEQARLRPGERVLDLACGTGIVARQAAVAVGARGQVVGVDLNPVMVEVAAALPAPAGAPIEWREGDAMALDLTSAAFDVVVCQQGLQFLPDRLAGAREMHRVLDEGGRVVLALWQGLDRHPLYEALADAEAPHLAAHGLPVTRAELAAPFSLGDPDEISALLREAGFAEVAVSEGSIEARFADADRFVERMEHAYAAVVPAFAEDRALFDRYLAAIGEDTRSVVEGYRVGDEIVVPMHTNLVTAQRPA